MKKSNTFITVMLLFGLAALTAMGSPDKEMNGDPAEPYKPVGSMDTAVFAGGCFWGMEAVFENLEGVNNVISGYSGGKAETASYSMVGTSQTDHAESVYIEYDSSVISYKDLLDVFFLVAHDPTQYNYQGPDIGPQYRSVVFYNSKEQKKEAESYIKELEKEKVYGQPIVTEISELNAFYPAEDYHQNFMALNPEHPYIVYWDVPKIRHLEEMFPQLLKSE